MDRGRAPRPSIRARQDRARRAVTARSGAAGDSRWMDLLATGGHNAGQGCGPRCNPACRGTGSLRALFVIRDHPRLQGVGDGTGAQLSVVPNPRR